MNRKKIAYILLILGIVLLIVNISLINFKDFNENNYFGIGSNLLLISAMILTIRGINKQEKNNKLY